MGETQIVERLTSGAAKITDCLRVGTTLALILTKTTNVRNLKDTWGRGGIVSLLVSEETATFDGQE